MSGLDELDKIYLEDPDGYLRLLWQVRHGVEQLFLLCPPRNINELRSDFQEQIEEWADVAQHIAARKAAEQK